MSVKMIGVKSSLIETKVIYVKTIMESSNMKGNSEIPLLCMCQHGM